MIPGIRSNLPYLVDAIAEEHGRRGDGVLYIGAKLSATLQSLLRKKTTYSIDELHRLIVTPERPASVVSPLPVSHTSSAHGTTLYGIHISIHIIRRSYIPRCPCPAKLKYAGRGGPFNVQYGNQSHPSHPPLPDTFFHNSKIHYSSSQR